MRIPKLKTPTEIARYIVKHEGMCPAVSCRGNLGSPNYGVECPWFSGGSRLCPSNCTDEGKYGPLREAERMLYELVAKSNPIGGDE